MEFRKMLMITLYAEQKKRHRFIEHSFILCGRRWGWDVQGNSIETCILSRVKQITSPGWMHETSTRTWCSGKTWRERWRGRWEGGSGWGRHVNSRPFHFNVWQNSLQIKKKKKKETNKQTKKRCTQGLTQSQGHRVPSINILKIKVKKKKSSIVYKKNKIK